MKRNIILTLFIGVLLNLGCEKLKFGDDFLEKAPGVDVTIDTIFSNIDNAQRLLWSAYRTMRYGLPAHDRWASPAPAQYMWDPGNLMYRNSLSHLTDESQSYDGTGGAINRYYNGQYNATNADGTNVRYSFLGEYAWSGIRMAYIFIENIDRVPDATPAYKNQLKHEAYMVIACLYLDMHRNLGGVPWVNKAFKTSDDFSNFPRLTAQATVDSIVSLCDKAAAVLPWKVENVEEWDGRFTRAAAMGLKTRALLFNASPLFNSATPYLEGEASDKLLTWHGKYDANLWVKARDAARDLITEAEATGDYGLYKNPALSLRQNWQDAYYKRGGVTGETIISVRDRFRSPTGGQTYYFHLSVEWGSGLISHNLVNKFPMANGLPITDPASGYDPDNPYVNRDPRLYETAVVNGDEWRGRTAELWIGGRERQTIAATNAATGYRLRKFILDNNTATNRGSIIHWPYLRMAEIYLSYAEAINEVNNGPNAEAYRCVNIVRNRVGLGDLPPGLNKEEFREAVFLERLLELTWEEVRWYDVVRWKMEHVFKEPITGMNIWRNPTTHAFTYDVFECPPRYWRLNWSPKWYLEAFPSAEIQKGYGLIQNPGW
jgi:starch-binding outer membrane protein, SusD/RagB family